MGGAVTTCGRVRAAHVRKSFPREFATVTIRRVKRRKGADSDRAGRKGTSGLIDRSICRDHQDASQLATQLAALGWKVWITPTRLLQASAD